MRAAHAHRNRLLVAAVALVGCGDDGGGASQDGGSDSDAHVCTAFDSRACSGDDVFWFDSCGARGELAIECPADRPCLEDRAACCRAPVASGFIDANPLSTSVSWTYGTAGNELAIDLAALATPNTTVRQKLGLRLYIDGIGTNLFLMSDLHETGGIGISLDFDTDPASGTLELGPGSSQVTISGGTLTKLNFPYDWTDKAMTLRLVREGDGWVRGYLDEGGTTTYIGGRQFGSNTLPTTLWLLHVLEGPLYYETTPLLDATFGVPTLDAKLPIAGSVDFPDPEFANLDLSFDAASSPPGRVRFGGMTPRCGDEGPLDLAGL